LIQHQQHIHPHHHPSIIMSSSGAARQAGATSLGMQSENFGYSRVRLRRIKKLQFGVVDPNELVSWLLWVEMWINV
jgi:hypothetical protein